MVSIREMTGEDLEQVAKLEQELFSTPWSYQSFQSALSRGDTIYLVAEKDGRVVGYCGLMQILDEGDITHVAVDASCRRRHVAQSMLRHLLLLAKNRGVSQITLEVRESNLAARGLYQKLGFAEEGLRRNFYEKPTEHGVIMWKRS